MRLLSGDHAMFLRRDQFPAVGGCDKGLPVLEEADPRIKLARFGRVRLVNRVVLTSGGGVGRVAGELDLFEDRGALGLKRRLGDRYPHIC